MKDQEPEAQVEFADGQAFDVYTQQRGTPPEGFEDPLRIIAGDPELQEALIAIIEFGDSRGTKDFDLQHNEFTGRWRAVLNGEPQVISPQCDTWQQALRALAGMVR